MAKAELLPIKKEFRPFTLTVETEKEAIALWHRLNAAAIVFEEGGYRSKALINYNSFDSFELFKAVDTVFNPIQSDLEKGNIK